MNKFKDLYDLLEHDTDAKEIFDKAPDYVKETIKERAQDINSYDHISGYIDKLTRGDD